jgi:hypothetical protein
LVFDLRVHASRDASRYRGRLPISANIDFALARLVQEWEHLKMLKDLRLRLSAIAPAVLTFLMLLPLGVMAQTPAPPASSQELLKPQELEALVAPIALYPGRMQIIRHTTFQTPTRVTSVPDSLPQESHSVPDMPSRAGCRAETTGWRDQLE